MDLTPLGIRWTIGDVSDNGWQALHLAIAGARRVFGTSARYAVCVNSVPLEQARCRVGDLADLVEWHAVERTDLPAPLLAQLDESMAEGVAWKLAPLRVFPDRWELSFDNDCILWELPPGIRDWLAEANPRRCLLAEDVTALYGRFADVCGPEPRNAGIRGLPPGYPLEMALTSLLKRLPATLDSELDEQGLQVAAASLFEPPAVVSVDDVSICSPFPPHRPTLGRSGAHFCGLNARHFSWQLDGRFAEAWIDDHWRQHLPALQQRVGLVSADDRGGPLP
jgi:hypothetical protein